MQIFESKKKNLLPTFLIWAIAFSIPFGMLLIVAKFNPLVILLFFPGFWFFYSIIRWFKVAVPKTIIRAHDTGLDIEQDNKTTSILWSDISGIKFLSSGHGLSVLVGRFARYLGFYRLETKSGNVDLSSALDNLDVLLKLVIEKAHLKRYSSTLERSIIGGSFATQMDWGNYPVWQKEENYIPNEKDFGVNVGGPSKSGILLFFVLAVAFTALFLIFQYLAGKGII